MEEIYSSVNRRSVLKSASGLIGGSLMAGSAAAAKHRDKGKKAIGNQRVSKFKEIIDAITVANGKAKVKDWAKGKKVEIHIKGDSITYTAQKIVKEINEGVKKGYWQVQKRAGELSIDLTGKGRSQFFDGDQLQKQSHCDGKSGVEGDTIYLDDGDVGEIQWGNVLVGGLFTIAAAIAGVLSGVGLIAIVLTAAGVLVGIEAGYITNINNGCGIKIDTEDNSVSGQHCDC